MSMTMPPLAKGVPVPEQLQLMERVVERSNMQRAYSRVKQNKGAPGVDGMSVKQLGGFLRAHWPVIKERLLEGSYKPKPVKRVAIPKTSGGLRPLGIPTVLDRLIQQALHQVLSPLLEPEFSESSFGFRPGRSAHQAVLQARQYQHDGKRWVVDMDLAQFFDEVNHEKLMAKMGRKVKDWRVKKLIRRYLRAGVLSGGVVSVQQKGTPQGGPLSPLLSNIVLDELDKELERRGHSFCRYADDCNIYVGSRKSGERVMASITRFVEQQLKLRVNLNKSAVARPWQRKFLGYSFSWHRKARMRVAKASIKRFKSNLKVLFRKGRGRNLQRFIQQDLNPVIRGWINYFRLSEFAGFAEQLDQWLRRHLRCILWRQWKRPWKRFQRLLKLGLSEERAARSAFNQRGPWFNAGASHMNQALPRRYFDQFGLICMLQTLRRLGPVLT
ncbi:MAG: group II intron reverse transcriptase/maturase [Desulfobacterales bacterium]|jgi:RNA-directed DNA polymerase